MACSHVPGLAVNVDLKKWGHWEPCRPGLEGSCSYIGTSAQQHQVQLIF